MDYSVALVFLLFILICILLVAISDAVGRTNETEISKYAEAERRQCAADPVSKTRQEDLYVSATGEAWICCHSQYRSWSTASCVWSSELSS